MVSALPSFGFEHGRGGCCYTERVIGSCACAMKWRATEQVSDGLSVMATFGNRSSTFFSTSQPNSIRFIIAPPLMGYAVDHIISARTMCSGVS